MIARIIAAVFSTFLVLLLLAFAAAAALFNALGKAVNPAGAAAVAASAQATADIPADYLTLYQQAAATCPGLPWTVLAAIGKIETDHGRSDLPGVKSGANGSGAMGPMQFIADTWDSYNPPGTAGAAGSAPSPYNPADAIPAAARKLCAEGARDGKDIPRALFSYNHATWYVNQVLTQADQYTAPPTVDAAPAPTDAATQAIAFARAQLGVPYVWGGDGPSEGGYDCSGLTKAAYASAGITLPRVAQDQYYATTRLPSSADILPGDLVFFGTPTNVHHVGIAIGNGQMIEAPRPGVPIRVGPILYPGNDFLGATRPF
ncbi:bifunctional lytic transglycosylase/C40 family peptidase [Yinghuangia sp. ASG 101]|uniref:C40 family peptidase n=1 Tax=Yinghuangia sp. ASG 101 TaxID=2896848 RepID=UPI001E3ED9EF|nr:NlpC/P60 family protein [Yinghuangia sp. ASG 101]UGQ10538.1 bifunctional lytic transglycosylase/C40 family peptidase [Yinghuangia sp. ASG 101]